MPCNQKEKNKKSTCQKLLDLFENNLAQMVLGRPPNKNVRIILIRWKIRPPGCVASFSFVNKGKIESSENVREPTLAVIVVFYLTSGYLFFISGKGIRVFTPFILGRF